MGYYTETGKTFKLFKGEDGLGQFQRIKLLCGTRMVFPFGMEAEKQLEILTYYVKVREQIYELVKFGDDFMCNEYDEEKNSVPENIIGIGNCDITVEDLDEMFGNWEEYVKKLKPATSENIEELVEKHPELESALVIENIFKAPDGKSYRDLKNLLDTLHTASPDDVRNALGALLENLEFDKLSRIEDATKIPKTYTINGKTKTIPSYTREIKKGEVWRVQFTRGVGHEIQDKRPALVISDDIRNATLGSIMCLAFKGSPVNPKHKHNQIEVVPSDIIYDGTEQLTKPKSRIELMNCYTLDRARFIDKYGELKPELFQTVLERFKKYYELPDDKIEPIEIDINEFFK